MSMLGIRVTMTSSWVVKKDTPERPLRLRCRCFCRHCVIRTRAESAIEYEHTKDSRKDTINLTTRAVCDAASGRAEAWQHRLEGSRAAPARAVRPPSQQGRFLRLHRSRLRRKDRLLCAHHPQIQIWHAPLTFTWRPPLHRVGWRNFQSGSTAGFDNFRARPTGVCTRFTHRLTVEDLFHPFQHFLRAESLARRCSPTQHSALSTRNEAEYGNRSPIHGRQARLVVFRRKTRRRSILAARQCGPADHFGVQRMNCSHTAGQSR